jgi:hypothetical protein
MDDETAEKVKAARHRRILLWCVAVGVGLPLVLLFVQHFRFAP